MGCTVCSDSDIDVDAFDEINMDDLKYEITSDAEVSISAEELEEDDHQNSNNNLNNNIIAGNNNQKNKGSRHSSLVSTSTARSPSSSPFIQWFSEAVEMMSSGDPTSTPTRMQMQANHKKRKSQRTRKRQRRSSSKTHKAMYICDYLQQNNQSTAAAAAVSNKSGVQKPVDQYSETDLLLLAFECYHNLDVQERRLKHRTHRNCFVASAMISYFLIENRVDNREEGLKLAQKLWWDDYFVNALNPKLEIRDFNHLYCFQDVHKHILQPTKQLFRSKYHIGHKDMMDFDIHMTADDPHSTSNASVLEFRQCLHELAAQMRAPNTGVDIRDREWNLKTYPQCFIGKEAVSWMRSNHIVKTREEAVSIGQLLLDLGEFEHVLTRLGFVDRVVLYRFCLKRDENESSDIC